ncbi:N-acetyltransferase [Pelagibacteraceae bacterium]|jgi:predicted N-acetyltransferase YhbS|nr:N-acetyltransferase [Pelagibacteraceae bacterium]MDC1302723.1 N-acetyltransferase [Pelagibacterales bacterium]|tara:strand:+ start:629 stop:1117 length:489 start_codon:yes stop_codon:yes gene_type:complete
MSHIRQISNEDNDKIIKLLYKSFGPGRFARSVYRLREKNDRDTEFSYIYELNNQILSSISYYKTFLNNDINGLLLGPLAVDPEHRGKGYGVELVKYTIALIKKTMAYDFILVIGDYHYYEKFGFKKINNTFSFYGPVNSEKVLILPLKDELKNNEYKIMEFN